MMDVIGKEFKVKNLSLEIGSNVEDFYKFEWVENRVVFLVYRIIVLFYCLGWLIAFWVTEPHLDERYTKATNIAEVMMILYMGGTAMLALWGNLEQKNGNFIRFVKNITWLFHSLSFATVIVATIVHWLFLSTNDPKCRSILNFHKHGVTSILLILDLFVVSFPVRLLHLLYVLICWFSYVIFMLSLHWTGVNSRVYSVVSWDIQPLKSTLFSLTLVFVGSTTTHLLAYAIYFTRDAIARKIRLPQKQNEQNLRFLPNENTFKV